MSNNYRKPPRKAGAMRNASKTKPAVIKAGEHEIHVFREPRGQVRIVAPPEVDIEPNVPTGKTC